MRLAETYAIRARELSDAVASLGLQICAGAQLEENLSAIKRLRHLFEDAGEELLAVIEPPKARACCASSGNSGTHQSS